MTEFNWKNGDQTLIFNKNGEGECKAEGGGFVWKLYLDHISLHFDDSSLLGVFADSNISIGANQYSKSDRRKETNPHSGFVGHFISFKMGDSPSNVVDRFEGRVTGNKAQWFRNGRGCESYTIDPDGKTLRGAVTATLQGNGDIHWSHGYVSRKVD